MILNKILYHVYLTGFLICLSTEYASVSVENNPSYIFGRVLNISQVLNMLKLHTRVVNMARLHRVLCKLCFKNLQHFEFLEF